MLLEHSLKELDLDINYHSEKELGRLSINVVLKFCENKSENLWRMVLRMWCDILPLSW